MAVQKKLKNNAEKLINNDDFLRVISKSFNAFIQSGTSRSTAKLKPLHGAIAVDLKKRLGDDYIIMSQGYNDDKEGEIPGRYLNKKVDITVLHQKKAVCGIAVKFVMQNYSQNSNNYFENMLGETANIRSATCPYFQVFIILDKLPYYNKEQKIMRWETFTEHNISKYIMLSRDDTNVYFHTPNKTLIYIVHIPDNNNLKTLKDYLSYYKTEKPVLTISKNKYTEFGSNVILNNYELFINKVYHSICAI